MPKTRTNISIDEALLAQARDLGLNVSAIAEAALRAALRQEEARRWHAEHAEALEAYRARIEARGPFLAPGPGD